MAFSLDKISNTRLAIFWSKVRILDMSTCWEYLGGTSLQGYGRVRIDNVSYYSHIVAYTFIKGEIPEGYEIDHICRNRACVNPGHLRAVKPYLNIIENSEGVAAKNSKKTQCSKGHQYVEGSYYESKKNNGRVSRVCKICTRTYNKNYRKKISALAP